MKKVLLSLLLLVVIADCRAQVKMGQLQSSKASSNSDKDSLAPYDSSASFLGVNLYQYVGQDLFAAPADQLMINGIYSFYKILINEDPYKGIITENKIPQDSIVGKYFRVVGAINGPVATEILYGVSPYYLILIEKSKGDTIYFNYQPQDERAFPFIVTGHYIKIQRKFVGKSYYLIAYAWAGLQLDYETNKEIKIENNIEWKITDVLIHPIDGGIKCKLVNNIKQTFLVTPDDLMNPSFCWTKNVYIKNKVKFGAGYLELILNRKVRIGMTKEMCLNSWGKPDHINKTTGANGVKEQWVYDSSYLYFEDGKLTAIQN